MRDVSERLRDIQEAIARITKYTNQGREKFDQDELVQTWVVHHLEIIGEAATPVRYLYSSGWFFLLSNHKPVVRHIRNHVGHDGIGPATIVCIFLARLGHTGLPAAYGQKLLRIVHRANPWGARICLHFDPLPRPWRGQHGAIYYVEANPTPGCCQARYLVENAPDALVG